MEERLPSQIYVVGNFLLLLVVLLALLMIPRAMALDPGSLRSLSQEQRFEQATGLPPLGASGLPELRIWSAPGSASASGIIVTPASIERYDLKERGGLAKRFEVTARVRETTPVAAQMILRLRELAAFDSHYLVCGAGVGSLSVSGYVDGREFNFRETGDCAGARSPAVDMLFRMAARKR